MDDDEKVLGQQDAVLSDNAPSSETLPILYSIFTSRQKALIVTLVAVAATFSGFASNIYFPAIPTIASDLGVTSELVNLTVTS
jgi:hypothetical protein